MNKKGMTKYYKFLVYVGLFLLINLAATTLFFRIDLTKDGLYSISDVSKKVVSTLSEPLTIHVFFTKNLPAPHNNTERYLHDLLAEYGIYGNRYFNYQFHDVSVKDGPGDPGTNRPSKENCAKCHLKDISGPSDSYKCMICHQIILTNMECPDEKNY